MLFFSATRACGGTADGPDMDSVGESDESAYGSDDDYASDTQIEQIKGHTDDSQQEKQQKQDTGMVVESDDSGISNKEEIYSS